MARKLELTDSFEHWDRTRPRAKWQCISIVNDTLVGNVGINGGKGITIDTGNWETSTVAGENQTNGNGSGILEQVFDTHETQWAVGCAFKLNDVQLIEWLPIISILDSSTLLSYFGTYYAIQCSLMLAPNQRFVFNRGDYKNFPTSQISDHSPAIRRNVFNYIEAYFNIGSSGSVLMKLNGKTVISATGVNTQETSTAYGDGVRIFHHKSTRYNFAAAVREYVIDSVYVVSGGHGLSDVRIEAHLPTANGATTDWDTPGAGSVNYDMVNDNPPDNALTFNEATAVNDTDLYTFPSLSSVAGSIHGVGVNIVATNDAADAPEITGVVRQSGVDYPMTAQPVLGTYEYRGNYFGELTNPATASRFTIAEVNADQFGTKRTA